MDPGVDGLGAFDRRRLLIVQSGHGCDHDAVFSRHEILNQGFADFEIVGILS